MHDFNWLSLFIKDLSHSNVHIFTSGVVFFIILALSLLAYPLLRKTQARLVPEGKASLPNILEISVEGILNLMEGIVGKDAREYFPLIGTLFVYIFLSNAIALIPGMLPPTDNISTNMAMGIIVFVYYNYMGIKKNGVKGYLQHFMGPIVWLAPLMIVIELIGHIVRPVSLSLRLFGNITGDHLVLGIFSGLVPLFIPVLFLFLGLFVSFIQAFVFSLLSTIYIGLATAHEEGHH